MESAFVSKLAQGRFTVPVVLAATVAIMAVSEVSYQNLSRITDAATATVDARIDALHAARWMSEAELGAHVYAGKGDARDHETYRLGIDNVQSSLSRMLATLDQVDVVQPASREDLRVRLAEHLTILEVWVRAAQEGRLDEARALASNDRGRQLRQDFRERFTSILDEIERGHREARASLRSAQGNDRWLVHGVTLLAGAALLMLMRQVNRDRRGREQSRQRLAEEVRARTAELRELAGHLVTAQEDERSRLARELHDELGALLTASKLELMRLRRSVEGMPAVVDRVNGLETQINKGIALKRNIIEALRPSSLDHLGLVASLSMLCEDSSTTLGIPVHATIATVTLGKDARLAVYRFVQEALTNISKYAKASEVHVTLAQTGDRVEVAVKDDGVGFEAQDIELARHGLRGMKVRMESLGGGIEIQSTAGQGANLRAWLPVGEDPVGFTEGVDFADSVVAP